MKITHSIRARPCLNCGTLFISNKNTRNNGKKYCSALCRKIYCGIIKTCKNCGKTFESYYRKDTTKYCSRSCYREDIRKEFVNLPCAYCEKIFTKEKCQAFRKDKDPNRPQYCSPECLNKAKRGNNNPLYLGNRKATRGGDWREIKENFPGIFCEFCAKTVYGKDKCLDHIVPYRIAKTTSKNPNDSQNLWPLCRSCHTKKTVLERKLYSDGAECFIKALINKFGGHIATYKIYNAFSYFEISSTHSSVTERALCMAKTSV